MEWPYLLPGESSAPKDRNVSHREQPEYYGIYPTLKKLADATGLDRKTLQSYIIKSKTAAPSMESEALSRAFKSEAERLGVNAFVAPAREAQFRDSVCVSAFPVRLPQAGNH